MATTNQNSESPTFAGAFRHRIEGKNRITIPSQWRFEEEVGLFMIRKTTEKCVCVMPKCEVDRLKAKADGMEPEDRSYFLSVLGANLRPVVLDKAGRISIPDELCKWLRIEREVMLSGSVDTFNIWNVADFEAAHPDDEARRVSALRRHGI